MAWLGKAAVLWALDEAEKVPARLVSTLVAVARYAGEDGRGAHPSASTVAMHTRKGERQAKRDLAELTSLGLLQHGDPKITAHIRADRRPNVYDLAVPRPVDNSPRGDAGDTPSTGHGVSPVTERGDIQGQNGVTSTTPEEVLKTSGKRARGSARAQPPPASQMCDRCGSYEHALQECPH